MGGSDDVILDYVKHSSSGLESARRWLEGGAIRPPSCEASSSLQIPSPILDVRQPKILVLNCLPDGEGYGLT